MNHGRSFFTAVFSISSTITRLKGYSPGELVFGRDMFLWIKHLAYLEFIRQKNQAQINKDNIQENRNQVDHDYNVLNKVMLTNHVAYKYETPYKGPFLKTRYFNNRTVNLKYGPIQIRHNIHRIKPYKYDTKIETINSKHM